MLTSFKENAFYTDKFSKTKPQLILLNRGGGGGARGAGPSFRLWLAQHGTNMFV